MFHSVPDLMHDAVGMAVVVTMLMRMIVQTYVSRSVNMVVHILALFHSVHVYPHMRPGNAAFHGSFRAHGNARDPHLVQAFQ